MNHGKTYQSTLFDQWSTARSSSNSEQKGSLLDLTFTCAPEPFLSLLCIIVMLRYAINQYQDFEMLVTHAI
jgi:hypothetical protein